MKIDNNHHFADARLDVYREYVKIILMPDGGNEAAALEIDIPRAVFLTAANQLLVLRGEFGEGTEST